MQFESGHIYHIYNQGNNRQTIFFDRENYLFFLRKIRAHIIPFADVLAWCLMPNHFHLMVYVNHTELDEQTFSATPSPTSSRTQSDTSQMANPGTNPNANPGATRSRTRICPANHTPNIISFNKSIGIMLASYTRAVNKQKNWSGSLFRSETKAVCLTETKGISPAWVTNMGMTQITVHDADLDYPNICFNYILNNPVKDHLVSKPEEWEFSSFADFVAIRSGGLISKSRIEEFGLKML